MIEQVINILLIAVLITGTRAIVNQLLYSFTNKDIGDHMDTIKNKKVRLLMKPVIACITCMTSIHGTTWYLILSKEISLLSYIITLLAVGGVNYIIHK